MTYITSVAQGINVIHRAIPAKAPLPPPAGTRWHQLTGTDKLLWAVTLVQTSFHLASPNGTSNVSELPPIAQRSVHSARERERGHFAKQCQRERNWRDVVADKPCVPPRQFL